MILLQYTVDENVTANVVEITISYKSMFLIKLSDQEKIC